MIKSWIEQTTPNTTLGEQLVLMQAEIDELRAQLAKLKAQEPVGVVEIDPLVGVRFNASCNYGCDLKNGTQVYLAAGAQGHTREQIGLQLDDRREGLGAHHVYCRTIGEDV